MTGNRNLWTTLNLYLVHDNNLSFHDHETFYAIFILCYKRQRCDICKGPISFYIIYLLLLFIYDDDDDDDGDDDDDDDDDDDALQRESAPRAPPTVSATQPRVNFLAKMDTEVMENFV